MLGYSLRFDVDQKRIVTSVNPAEMMKENMCQTDHDVRQARNEQRGQKNAPYSVTVG
jgi:hypothetical protein